MQDSDASSRATAGWLIGVVLVVGGAVLVHRVVTSLRAAFGLGDLPLHAHFDGSLSLYHSRLPDEFGPLEVSSHPLLVAGWMLVAIGLIKVWEGLLRRLPRPGQWAAAAVGALVGVGIVAFTRPPRDLYERADANEQIPVDEVISWYFGPMWLAAGLILLAAAVCFGVLTWLRERLEWQGLSPEEQEQRTREKSTARALRWR